MKRNLAFLILSTFLCQIHAQHLRRQVDFGVQLAPVSKALAGELSLTDTSGVLVKTIVPNGTADVMEMLKGDIIRAIDNKQIQSLSGLQKELRNYRGGDEVLVKVWRNSKEIELSGIFLAKAIENYGEGNILYDEVAFEEGYLRTITQSLADEGRRMPGLLFIPAYPCTSIDNLSPWHPYKKLVDGLAEKGIVVMRIEKSGVGDCMDTPACQEVSFDKEQEVYKAGFAKLRSYDFVDTNNIFILGHDLGGMIAPIIAIDSAINPKGMIVYGTILESWMEHLVQLARYQHPLRGGDYRGGAHKQKALMKLSYELLENKQTPETLASKNEVYASILKKSFGWDEKTQVLGRHYSFWQQVQDQNLTEAWANCDAFVLSMAGEADAQILDPIQHKEIVKIVNSYHPGKAQYVGVEETNHIFLKVGSMKEGMAVAKDPEKMFGMYQSNFNFGMIDRMAEWILEKSDK